MVSEYHQLIFVEDVMPHLTIYDYFRKLFPQFMERIETWFPNGKNSVRIRMLDNQDIIFTYNGPKDWRLETVDSFIKQLKGE